MGYVKTAPYIQCGKCLRHYPQQDVRYIAYLDCNDNLSRTLEEVSRKIKVCKFCEKQLPKKKLERRKIKV